MSHPDIDAIPLVAHEGWQDSQSDWDLWRDKIRDENPSARAELIVKNGPHTDHFKAVKKRLSYADQPLNDDDDLEQQTYEIIIALVDEFDPTRAESFKAFVLDRGLKRAIDVARRDSEIPRRVRESTAIFNQAKEQLAQELGDSASVLLRGREGTQRILDYAVASGLWNSWLHAEPTAEWIEKNIEIRNAFVRQASIEALTTGPGGETHELHTEHHASAEEEALEIDIQRVIKGILDKVLSGLEKDHYAILAAYAEGLGDGGEKEAIKRVHAILIAEGIESRGVEAKVSWGQVVARVRLAQSAARTRFLMFQANLGLEDSADARLEIIERYFSAENEEYAFDEEYWASYDQLVMF